MAVEWLRSCYSSAWHLFRDSPETLVPGRYYFSPPGTPFYPGQHNLGSRTWNPNQTATDDDQFPIGEPPLGESLSYPHRWQSGALPAVVPNAAELGHADCIANGDTVADGVPIADTLEGMPLACFTSLPSPNVDYLFAFDVWSCETQAFFARSAYLLAYGYLGDLTQYLTARFTGANVFVTARSALYPAYAIVVHPEYAIVQLAGTSSLQQALVEAINAFEGPQDYGAFATGALWYDYATIALKSLVNAGVNDDRPIMFGGHSYGAASAMVAAARAILGMPGREVRYMTFGCPKPGDKRLATLLRSSTIGLSLVNDGDLIGVLPPTPLIVTSLATLLPPPLAQYAAWGLWEYPPETTVLGLGTIQRNVQPTVDSMQLWLFIVQIFTNGAIPAFPAHDTTLYLANILARCPQQFPIDIGNVTGLEVDTAVELGNVMGMLVDTTVPTPCCPAGMPMVMQLTIVAATGSGAFLAGKMCNIVFSGTFPTGVWSGSFTVSSLVYSWALRCIPPWQLTGGSPPWFQLSQEIPNQCGSLWFDTTALVGGVACEMVVLIGPIGGSDVQTGSVIAFAATSPPAGFLVCDGSAVSRSVYANLFAVIGITFGAGDGSTTFNLPDLRDRQPIGISPGSLGFDRPSARSLADTGGNETHALTAAESGQPGRSFAFTALGNVLIDTTTTPPVGGTFDGASAIGGADGGDTSAPVAVPISFSIAPANAVSAHSVVNPFVVLLWCIAY